MVFLFQIRRPINLERAKFQLSHKANILRDTANFLFQSFQTAVLWDLFFPTSDYLKAKLNNRHKGDKEHVFFIQLLHKAGAVYSSAMILKIDF